MISHMIKSIGFIGIQPIAQLVFVLLKYFHLFSNTVLSDTCYFTQYLLYVIFPDNLKIYIIVNVED
jgi:hypothetical protein